MLIVADSGGDPPELSGVAALAMDPSGASKTPVALPWLHATLMPPIARTADDVWLAAIGQREAEDSWQVGLWRGGPTELLGEGDRFEAVDMTCSADRCALLTNRLGKVAAAGANVWIGNPNEPASTWKRVEIIPSAGDSDAHPVELAGIGELAGIAEAATTDGGPAEPPLEAGPGDAGAGDAGPDKTPMVVVAALLEKEEVVFVEAGAPDGPRELSRLPAPYGIIDAIAAPVPMAITYGTPPAPPGAGCLPGDGKVRIERAGQPHRELTVHAAPLSGWLRQLTQGTLAAFIAPLGCRLDRKVVYGLLLDAAGAPISELMPIGDGESFAVTTRGDDVDLWVQHADAVVWVRATCSVR
jgi:hypothetical protein